VQPAEDGEWLTLVDLSDDVQEVCSGKVGLSSDDGLLRGGSFDALQIREAFGAKEILGHVHRGETDGRAVADPERGGL